MSLRWAFIIRRLETPPSALQKLLGVVAFSFIVRSSVIVFVLTVGDKMHGSEIPVLILPEASTVQLLLTISYYLFCEIFCGYVAVHLLRQRVFSEDHEPLMERILLPSQLEIDSDEVDLIDALDVWRDCLSRRLSRASVAVKSSIHTWRFHGWGGRREHRSIRSRRGAGKKMSAADGGGTTRRVQTEIRAGGCVR